MKIRHVIVCFSLSAMLAILSCRSQKPEQEVVVTVNKSPIYKSELQKEIVRYAKQNPNIKITNSMVEERLNTLIEKKLMIQEAARKGITKDERFVETIKTFWEQTLIRELLDTKNKEWADRIFVKEDEIKKEYERMLFRPRLYVAKAATKQAADEITKAMQSGKHPDGEETLGPLFYEDVSNSPLANAFDMKAGEVKAFATDGSKHIVINVIEKQPQQMPPLKEVYIQIKESLLAQKKQEEWAEWLDDIKKSAKINTNYKILQDIAHD
ncbi:MAG: hypothetical protein ABIK98_05170 [Pseudomonadota bacterium]